MITHICFWLYLEIEEEHFGQSQNIFKRQGNDGDFDIVQWYY
jgi:hypothetical protein